MTFVDETEFVVIKYNLRRHTAININRRVSWEENSFHKLFCNGNISVQSHAFRFDNPGLQLTKQFSCRMVYHSRLELFRWWGIHGSNFPRTPWSPNKSIGFPHLLEECSKAPLSLLSVVTSHSASCRSAVEAGHETHWSGSSRFCPKRSSKSKRLGRGDPKKAETSSWQTVDRQGIQPSPRQCFVIGCFRSRIRILVLLPSVVGLVLIGTFLSVFLLTSTYADQLEINVVTMTFRCIENNHCYLDNIN